MVTDKQVRRLLKQLAMGKPLRLGIAIPDMNGKTARRHKRLEAITAKV